MRDNRFLTWIPAALAVAVSCAGCVTKPLPAPDKASIRDGSPLPIDGVWKHSSTGVAFRLEAGRFVFHRGFDPSLVHDGSVALIDISQTSPREYECRHLTWNRFSGKALGWATCRILVDSSVSIRIETDPIPGFGGSIDAYSAVALDDTAWFESQYRASRIVEPPAKSAPASSDRYSVGTCFAVSPDGYIATAAHVVTGATTVEVKFANRNVATAQVVRVSVPTDVALLKVETETPDFLPPTVPTRVKLGDRVFTIGFPVVSILGFEAKYSEGSVSALSGPRGDSTYLQISTPIHPGNSGGPLVNASGELVGIVVASASLEAFIEAAGTLPQNVGWAIKREFLQALVSDLGIDAPGPRKARDPRALTEASVCLITAK